MMGWWAVSAQCVSTKKRTRVQQSRELKQAVARKLSREEQLSREKWRLTAEEMKGDLIAMIDNARWIYHKSRGSMNTNQKMIIESVMQKLERISESIEGMINAHH